MTSYLIITNHTLAKSRHCKNMCNHTMAKKNSGKPLNIS